MEAENTSSNGPGSQAKVILAWVLGAGVLALGARSVATHSTSAPQQPESNWSPAAAGSAASAPGDAGSNANQEQQLLGKYIFPSNVPGRTWRQTFPQLAAVERPIGIELSERDRAIFAKLAAGGLSERELADVFPNAPYRVKFICSDVVGAVERIEVDATRSGKADETWEIDGITVDRILPGDQGRPFPSYLRGGRWLPH